MLRLKLDYPHVVSTLALVAALGTGGAYAADSIHSTDIVDGEVKTQDLAVGGVTGARIADGTVESADIAKGAVRTTDLAGGAVSNSILGQGAVRTENIFNATIRAQDVAGETLTGATIANGSLTGADVKDASLSTFDVAHGTLTASDMSADSIGRRELKPGAVGVAEHGTVPAARVMSMASQRIPDEGTRTVSFDRESFDTADLWSPDRPTRLTAPVTGIYHVQGKVSHFDPGQDQHTGELWVHRNGDRDDLVDSDRDYEGPSRWIRTFRVSSLVRLVAGEYVEMSSFVRGSSDSFLTWGSETGEDGSLFQMHWVGPA